MRLIVATVAAIALLTVSARAQNANTPWMSLPTKDASGDHTKDEHQGVKADNKAYRSALDGIPQIKDHDPWRSVRETPKTKSPR